MSFEESLHDVTVRERQLEAHILRSADYLKHANQDLKRQMTMLYTAIAFLMAFQGLFTFTVVGQIPYSVVILVSVTSFLSIVNCLLLIKTKAWLHRLNKAWLAPQEKLALEALENQRAEILNRAPRTRKDSDQAGLN